jgi:aryl-alcohol dehydrogenase-like predicted oxidoreductase
VIATAGSLTRPGPGQCVPDGRPEHLRQACDGSLARLRLDRIDLYEFHRPDPKVSVAESMSGMGRLGGASCPCARTGTAGPRFLAREGPPPASLID